MQQDEMELVANRCRLELASQGIGLKVVEKLPEMVDLFGMLEKTAGPAADQNQLLLTERNCFSVFCFEAGEPVMGFAVRLDDLGDEDAQSFLPRSIETIFGVKVTNTIDDPYKGKLWGRAAYFGDLKSVQQRGLARRSKNTLQLASAYAHYRAFTHYGATTNYCFLRGVDARNGIPYGFFEADPYVWETDRDLYPDGSPVWVMQLSKGRLPSLMAATSLLLPKHLAVDDKPRLEVVGEGTTGSM